MGELDGSGDVAAAYDRWAASYDTDANKTRQVAARMLRAAGLGVAGRDVLEVGCGTGNNTLWLAEQEPASLIGLDFSDGMLARARERVAGGRARFVRHDAREPWPVEEASADLVVAMLVLEHLEDVRPFYARARRALRAGGELFVCELHPARQREGRQAAFVDAETGRSERIAAYLHDASELVNAALDAGFVLRRLDEAGEPDDAASAQPRVLALRLAAD